MSAAVTISSPPRGSEQFASVTRYVSQLVLTRGWGAQPATALIDFATETPLDPPPPGALVQAAVAGHTFWGIVMQPEHALSEQGFTMAYTCEDFRHFLQLDVVYGRFNLQDNQVVDGRLVRRFKHLLPANVSRGLVTYTDTPYSAAQVLQMLLSSPWVESPWTIGWLNAAGAETTGVWHPALQNFPVFDLDYSGGVRLGQALVEISERVGLTFGITGTPKTYTIADGYRLTWVLRGDGGVLPQFTWSNGTVHPFPQVSTNRRLGTQYAGNPTRVSVVGDQNLYQVLNVVLERDWLPAWEAFWEPLALVEDIYNYCGDDQGRAYKTDAYYTGAAGDQMPGYLAAAARAERITVADYVAEREQRLAGSGAAFMDLRRYAGRSRMRLPAMLYVKSLVFRAFRVASGQSLLNTYGQTVALNALRIVNAEVQDVLYDPATGGMTPGTTNFANGNGLVLAQGVRLLSEDMQLFRPEYFDLTGFTAANDRWAEQAFQIDDSGEGYQFVLLDERVVRTTGMFEAEDGPGSLEYFVPKADPVVSVPNVRAALVFAAERFNYTEGTGQRDSVESAPGLCGQFVCAQPSAGPVEIAFADGQRAGEKAAVIAASLLNRQTWFVAGGYEAPYEANTRLHPMLNRVTVRYNASSGYTEEVDFTAERPHQADGWGNLVLEPPRNFDRRTMEWGQVPGLREQRVFAEQMRVQAELFRGPKGARWRKEAQHAWDLMRGYDSVWTTLVKDGATAGTLAAGTPLWRESTAKLPVKPASVSGLSSPQFVGVTVPKSISGARPVPVTAKGHENEVLARVAEPLNAGDPVGFHSGGTYLVAGGFPMVGTALEGIGSGEGTRLVRVRLASSGNKVQQFLISTVYAGEDYVAGKPMTYDPATSAGTAGPDGTFIAVAPLLRQAQKPTSAPGGTYVHSLHPAYAVDQLIVAAFVPEGTGVADENGNDCKWVDVTPGRAWAVPLPLCLGGLQYSAPVHCGDITYIGTS